MIAAVAAVTLDVGGPLYPDETFLAAALDALDTLAPDYGRAPVDRAAARRLYDDLRTAQSGGLRTALAAAFLGTPAAAPALHAAIAPSWRHPRGSLYPDVLPALARIAPGRRIAVLANQDGSVIDALRRDGVADYVDVWGISALVGYEKPSAKLFTWTLDRLGTDAPHTVHVGNRLDTDVRPAKALGMPAVWLLRGEALDDPTPAQRSEPDATIRTLAELPDLLGDPAGARRR